MPHPHHPSLQAYQLTNSPSPTPHTTPPPLSHPTQYLHNAFTAAGGGTVPEALLPLYACAPTPADAAAARRIQHEREEAEYHALQEKKQRLGM